MTSAARKTPVASNTGVTSNRKEKITSQIDWLQITTTEYPVLPESLTGTGTKAQAIPRNGYTLAEKYTHSGTVVMCNPARLDMSWHTVVSGSACRCAEPEELLKLASSARKITRIDIAVDVYNRSWSSEMFRKAYDDDKIKTTARELSGYGSWTSDGFTLYAGSKHSDKMTRVYDKAAEQKVDADWWRVETVFKSRYAKQVVKALLSGASIVSIVRGHFDVDATWWLSVMNDDTEIVRGEKHTPATERWLLGQVASAIAKYMFETDSEIWLKLKDAVTREFERIDTIT